MPVSQPDILFALIGDVLLSSRALRQLRWLAEDGFTVETLTFGEERNEGIAPTVAATSLRRPAGAGPRFFWSAHRTVRAAATGRPARAYHASDLYTLPALAAAASENGGRLVYDSRELYPHVDATAGRPWARGLWSVVERRYIRKCDAVMTVNDSIARRLTETYRIPEPAVVRNVSVPPPVAAKDDLRRRLGIPPGRRIALYQGLFHRGRGLEALVDAMARIPEADLVLIGEGPIRGELVARSEGNPAPVHFLPFTPPDELPSLTASADVGVHVPEPITESIRLALPNKLFEYLAADLPVVVADLPEMAAVVDGFDVGLTVPPGDPEHLHAALRTALFDERARQRWKANIPGVLEAFDPGRERERFLDVYRELLR